MRLLYRNAFILFLSLFLFGTIAFYNVRNNTQVKLNERIITSLALNQKAVDLLDEGEFAESRELLLESLSLNRLNAETYVYLAFVELGLDNHQQAYEHSVSALNMEVVSHELIKNLADLLIRNGYYDEAERHLVYGLRDFSGNEDLLFLLGKVRLINGDYKSSINAFNQIFSENNNKDIYKYLGLAYYYSGDKEKAREYYIEYLIHRELLEREESLAVDFLHNKVLKVWGEENG